MVSFLFSFLVAQAVTEYSGFNFTKILLNEFDKIKNRSDFDPTTIKRSIKYNYDDNPKKFNISMEVYPKMEITGLSKLVFKDIGLEFNPLPMKFNLSLKYSLPYLKGNGTYKLKGRALNFVTLKGHGPFYIKLEDISGFVNLTIGHNGTQFVVENLDFEIHFIKLKHYFQNLIYKGLSKVTNTIMNSFSKHFVNKLLIKNENVMSDVKKKLSSIIDNRLYKIHDDIMQYVTSYLG